MIHSVDLNNIVSIHCVECNCFEDWRENVGMCPVPIIYNTDIIICNTIIYAWKWKLVNIFVNVLITIRISNDLTMEQDLFYDNSKTIFCIDKNWTEKWSVSNHTNHCISFYFFFNETVKYCWITLKASSIYSIVYCLWRHRIYWSKTTPNTSKHILFSTKCPMIVSTKWHYTIYDTFH